MRLVKRLQILLFLVHYGSEKHLFQKQQLAQCQVNVLLTKLNYVSTSTSSISISFMLEKISEKRLII